MKIARFYKNPLSFFEEIPIFIYLNMKGVILVIGLILFSEGFCKIAPKDGEDKIVIKKGDTLWDIARKYYNDPRLWPKFHEYNIIENPDLIYPGERLAIGKSLALSLASAMRKKMRKLEKDRIELQQKIELLKKESGEEKQEYEKQIEELKKQLPSEKIKHQEEIEAMEKELLCLQDEITQLKKEKAGLDVSLSARIIEIEEKQKRIKRKEEEIELLEEKLKVKNDEIEMLNTGIEELSYKLKNLEKVIKEKDEKIRKLENEKALFTDFAHFLIFALISGLFALSLY